MVEPRPTLGDSEPAHGPTHPDVRYEPSDVRFRPVAVIIAVAAVLAVFHFVIMWRYFLNSEAHQARIKESPYPLAPAPSAVLPPEPRLEQLDRIAGVGSSNVYERMQGKEALLDRYGPTAEAGYVQIPVEQAMKLVADRLPVRPAAERPGAGKDNGLVGGGEPNSGRRLRGP